MGDEDVQRLMSDYEGVCGEVCLLNEGCGRVGEQHNDESSERDSGRGKTSTERSSTDMLKFRKSS